MRRLCEELERDSSRGVRRSAFFRGGGGPLFGDESGDSSETIAVLSISVGSEDFGDFLSLSDGGTKELKGTRLTGGAGRGTTGMEGSTGKGGDKLGTSGGEMAVGASSPSFIAVVEGMLLCTSDEGPVPDLRVAMGLRMGRTLPTPMLGFSICGSEELVGCFVARSRASLFSFERMAFPVDLSNSTAAEICTELQTLRFGLGLRGGGTLPATEGVHELRAAALGSDGLAAESGASTEDADA